MKCPKVSRNFIYILLICIIIIFYANRESFCPCSASKECWPDTWYPYEALTGCGNPQPFTPEGPDGVPQMPYSLAEATGRIVEGNPMFQWDTERQSHNFAQLNTGKWPGKTAGGPQDPYW